MAPGLVDPITNHLQREGCHRSLRCSWGQRNRRRCLPPVSKDPLLRLERQVLGVEMFFLYIFTDIVLFNSVSETFSETF